MAYTLTQLEALEAAIATGELSVSYDGKQVTYRSIAELTAARDLIKGELEATGLLTPTPRRSYAAHSKD